MKLVRFTNAGSGPDRIGVLAGQQVHDLTALLSDPGLEPHADPMVRLIGNWDRLRPAARQLSEEKGGYELAEVRLGPPLRRPGKIVAAPANYIKHVQEMQANGLAPNPGSGIAVQGVFLKASSSIIGPGDTIVLPYPDRRTDHEVELALVIGKEARQIEADRAFDYIFGYTAAIDVTMRGKEDRGTRKNFDTFTPLGPVLVTADEIPDPHAVDLELRVNGELRQKGNTRDLTWNINRLMAYASSVMTLEPGDVFITGTPDGVGPLEDGDTVTIRLAHVGEMSVGVARRATVHA